MSSNNEKNKIELIDKRKPISDKELTPPQPVNSSTLVIFLIYTFFGIISSLISWNSNKYNPMYKKIIFTIIAYLLGPIYIIWFIYSKYSHNDTNSSSTPSVYNSYYNNPKYIVDNTYIADNSALDYFK